MVSSPANRRTMYHLTIPDQTLTIEGKKYTAAEIALISADNNSPFNRDLLRFLHEWFNSSPFVILHTSGSTGIPKKIVVRKEQMMQSACLTCSFLKLKSSDKALLCLPVSYIAGKMMVVRALVASLNLYSVPSTGHPLANTTQQFQFAAMVPLQVHNSLQIPAEKEQLQKIEKLIIGGSVLDTELSEAVKEFPSEIYATYGMTETLSHIAMRRLNGSNASSFYTPFPSVTLSLSANGTLVIDAPLVSDQRLTTNDVACLLPNGCFEILGRIDNVINSGGIKIQIETVENLLQPILPFPFAVTSIPDPKFGEIVVLLVASPINMDLPRDEIAKVLSPYQVPRKTLIVPRIPLTSSGKINRAEVKEIAHILL